MKRVIFTILAIVLVVSGCETGDGKRPGQQAVYDRIAGFTTCDQVAEEMVKALNNSLSTDQNSPKQRIIQSYIEETSKKGVQLGCDIPTTTTTTPPTVAPPAAKPESKKSSISASNAVEKPASPQVTPSTNNTTTTTTIPRSTTSVPPDPPTTTIVPAAASSEEHEAEPVVYPLPEEWWITSPCRGTLGDDCLIPGATYDPPAPE